MQNEGVRRSEQRETQDKVKLQTLRRLALQGFEEIEQGEFESVTAVGIEEFLKKSDVRARVPKRS